MVHGSQTISVRANVEKTHMAWLWSFCTDHVVDGSLDLIRITLES